MPRLKVSELSGAALDYAVALAEDRKITKGSWIEDFTTTRMGYLIEVGKGMYQKIGDGYSPTGNWDQAGPIIDAHPEMIFWINHEAINKLGYGKPGELQACAMTVEGNPNFSHGRVSTNPYYGVDKRTAAMRCYVANKLGESIEIPEELCGS